MSSAAGQLAPRVAIMVRRRYLIAIAVAIPALLAGGYVATNVSASMAQRSLHARWDRSIASGSVDIATLAGKTFARGEPVARLSVASIGLDLIAVEDGNGHTAPSHVASTVPPGIAGVSAIRGGRFGFGNQFMGLDRLHAGDVIDVQTIAGSTRFVIDSAEVEQTVDLSIDSATPMLVLITPARSWGGGGELVVRARARGSDN